MHKFLEPLNLLPTCQAFKLAHGDKRPPGVWKTLMDVISQVKSAGSFNNSCELILLIQ